MASCICADNVEKVNNDEQRFLYRGPVGKCFGEEFVDYENTFDHGCIVQNINPCHTYLFVTNYNVKKLLNEIDEYGLFTVGRYKYYGIIQINDIPFVNFDLNGTISDCNDMVIDMVLLQLYVFAPIPNILQMHDCYQQSANIIIIKSG